MTNPLQARAVSFNTYPEGVCVMSDKGKVCLNKLRGRWYVDLFWKGKRYYYSSYNGVPCYVKAMADQLLAEIRGDINKGCFNPLKYQKAKPLNLKTYFERWIKRKENKLASATISDYNKSFNNYIFPILGNPLLENINFDMLEDLQGKITREPKGKKNVMYALYAVLRDAKKSGYIAQLPDRPSFTGEDSVIPPEINYIKADDIELIIEKIPESDRNIFRFIQYTGCRVSEARALPWTSIKEDHVVIEQTFGSKEEVKAVKNRKPRKIPRYSLLDKFLDDLPHTISPYVFVNPRTGRHYGRDFNRIWRKACRDAGLKVVQLRYLRHSLGCNLLDMNADIDLEDLRSLYGHADIKMTKRYVERSTTALKMKLDNVYELKQKGRAIDEQGD